MIEIIFICFLFLASNGDLICRCEEQIVQSKAQAQSIPRPPKGFRPVLDASPTLRSDRLLR